MFGKPEIVDWSPNIPGHSGDNEIKQMFHIGIFLSVSCPYFDPDETWISLGVRNGGRKALGIGPGGLYVYLDPSTQIIPCTTVLTGGISGPTHSTLIVNTGSSENDIIATFDAATKLDARSC